MIILDEEKTIRRVVSLSDLPEWMKLAAEGKKIGAIRELRRLTQGSVSADGVQTCQSLIEAKTIVEDLMRFMRTHEEEVKTDES